ncbi:uncharacterized protein LOC143185811 isoform X2 [Calliopsis andreniformis]
MDHKIQNIQRNTRTFLKNEIYKLRDDFAITNSKVQSWVDKDHIWTPQYLDISIANTTPINKKYTKKLHCPLKGFIENPTEIKKVKNKYNLNKPIETGIKNMKQTHYTPAKFKKSILPRNNVKLNCFTLRSTSPLNTVKMKKVINAK